MLNKLSINSKERILIIYIFLAAITLAVFWQVNQYGFINLDDPVYVVQNNHIRSGMTLESMRWAFTTKYFGLWNPMVWISFMFDYQLFGLNAGGYHVSNVILHILSTLLLFWLFNRMTGEVWKSTFVAACFAIHPLHVESVAWIAERKDVLSAFFWMLTLCLYVYYTEKTVMKRYAFVLVSFIFAMMSKPMVMTLPFMMILLDYWPLKRFESKEGNLILWQLKEKAPFFFLLIILVMITFYNPDTPDFTTDPDLRYYPFNVRLGNVPVAFMAYLGKTFWPRDLSVLYPLSMHVPVWKILGTSMLIVVITIVVIVSIQRLPYLFVGWFWYAIALAPVIGIVQISLTTPYAMADRYHYLPSIGIGIVLAWGWPVFFQKTDTNKKILFSVAITFLFILVILSAKQCGYWKNSTALFHHAIRATRNNDQAHNKLGFSLSSEGKLQNAIEHFNEAIKINNNYYTAYINRGCVYAYMGQHHRAVSDYNKAIGINKEYPTAYYNRGNTYVKLGQYQKAVDDYNKAISIRHHDISLYYNRGNVYNKLALYQRAIADYNEAIRLNPHYVDAYNNRGNAYARLGQYQLAIADYNKSIQLNPRDMQTYFNRFHAYLNSGDSSSGCREAQKVCGLGECRLLEWAKQKGYCL